MSTRLLPSTPSGAQRIQLSLESLGSLSLADIQTITACTTTSASSKIAVLASFGELGGH